MNSILLRSCAVVLVYLLTMPQVRSSEILVVFPTTAQSHYRVVRPLIHGLLDRGHRLLVITNFPDAEGRANLSHINIAGFKPHSKLATNENSIAKALSRFVGNVDTYATILGHPSVVDVLRSGRKFDLVIAEYFTTTPIFAPIATAVDAPIVGLCPMITFPWLHDVMGVETRLSYMPNIYDDSTDRMTFVQQIRNIVYWTFFEQITHWVYTPKVRKINQNYHGIRTDTLMEAMANISMVFTNSHHSMFMSLPKVPGIVEVGGIHVENEKPLPQDLNDFVENADHGVILFSLGTVVSELSMGVDKLNHIFEAFSRLKQRVIMKFDAESYKIQLPNVKVVKWFPQRDLLAHPKVLLFISHAGMMSTIETVHCGKPMVAIPIFGDQPFNANLLAEKQVAIVLDYASLNGDQLFDAINEALTENYRINAKKLQQLYSDRPQSPLETAIYWTEYVIRNKDDTKEMLKSPIIHLNLYQTSLLDVFAAFLLPTVMTICTILWALRHLKKS